MSIHGCGEAQPVCWLLQHLLGKLDKLMGQRLKKETTAINGRGDGLDRQCSGAVTRRWLQQSPAAPSCNMEQVFSRGGGDKLFRLSPILCSSCRGIMPPRSLGRKRSSCDECYRARVRGVDAERQARRRRLA